MKRAAALAIALLGLPRLAEAGTCVGRPTDAGGYAGYTYGAAEVKSFAGTAVRVHYATSGQHAPNLATTRQDGVPDTVALAADLGDQALGKYAAMGYKAPPSDASCASNGGDDKLDIYLVAFAGADGTTVPDNCNGNVCGSFVLSESTFTGRGYASAQEGFSTVVTHELFHAVQNAYDQGVDRFWAEGTAQWAMKVVHPDLSDFERQLPAFFAEPNRSIDTQPSGVTAGYLYGSSVWPLFLATKYGEDTVRAVYDGEAAGAKAIDATDAVLKAKGTSLAEAFPLFWAWNAATKAYAGAGGYPDAAKYPGVKLTPFQDGTTGITSGLGAFLYLASSATSWRLALDTDPARNAGLVVPLEGGKAALDRAKPLAGGGHVDLGEGDAIVVVAGITTKKTDAKFTLSIVPAQDLGNDVPGASSSGGGGGDSGGCRTSPRGGDGLAGLALLAAGVVLARRRR